MLLIFFIVVASSIGFFFLVWLIVVALQFIRPDRAIKPSLDSELIRRIQMKAGKITSVQFEDIRDLERERVFAHHEADDYLFSEGLSEGWPESWKDDIYLRRN